MSSPLSSLKKGARSPNLPGCIPGHRPIPFRHPEYSEDESRLLEEITTNMAASRHKMRDPFTPATPSMDSSPNPSMRTGDNNGNAGESSVDLEDTGLASSSDRELMKLMMARLAIMEQKVQQQQQQISTKDRRIKVLEDKLLIMTKARGDSNNSNGDLDKEQNKATNANDRVRQMEHHCLLLQQQIHEMETFLADYGMVWVGEQDDPESDIYLDKAFDQVRQEKQLQAGLELDDVEETTGEPHFRVDFNRLFENIRDLNVIAGEGQQVVQYRVDGARLSYQETIPITFYSNGMLMFDGPFRSYSDPSTVQCVQDFLDGYFPSELQSRYPEGVPFNVRDMRTVIFKIGKAMDVFSGVGQILGGEEVSSRLINNTVSNRPDQDQISQDWTKHATTSSTSGSSATTSAQPHPHSVPMKVPTFLNRLPQSLIKDGKVIDIRASVGHSLSGAGGQEKQQVAVVETLVTKAIQKTLSEARVDRPKTPRDITTLRVKSESGSHTYIVKMRFKETVGDLRKYLDCHRASEKGALKDYDILCAHPHTMFTDNCATMEACGLTPNGVLCLQAKKKT